MLCSMSDEMEACERTSQGMATHVPPLETISRHTVLMVDALELGSGGKGVQVSASLVDLAETITGVIVSCLWARRLCDVMWYCTCIAVLR